MPHKSVDNICIIYDREYPVSPVPDLSPPHPLDYLQMIQVAEKDPGNEMFAQKAKELEKAYEEYKNTAAANLLNYFCNHFSCDFTPDILIAPPTERRYLQEPITHLFKAKYPSIADLSDCFEKKPAFKSIGKVGLVDQKKPLLTSRNKLLLIDDVIASSDTIKSITHELRNIYGIQSESFIAICFLYIDAGKYDREKAGMNQVISQCLAHFNKRHGQHK